MLTQAQMSVLGNPPGELKEHKDHAEIPSDQGSRGPLIFSNARKISAIDNDYEFTEKMWVVSIVNTKGNNLLKGHAVIVLEGIEAGTRVLMVDEKIPEPSSIEPNKILLRKIEGEITAYWTENSKIFKKSLDKSSMEALFLEFPQNNWNCEITYGKNAPFIDKLISMCSCSKIDIHPRCFINQYDMTSNSPENMPDQNSFNEKGYICN